MAEKKPKAPRFEVYHGIDRETYAQAWHWRLIARNGEIIASGEGGFTSRRDALRATESVKRAVAKITEGS